MAELNRDAHLPDLAKSLNNHALRLAEAGRRNEAVQVSEQAVALFEELAELNRDAHLPDLAKSLNNHALRLAMVGRQDEAAQAIKEYRLLLRELLAVASPEVAREFDLVTGDGGGLNGQRLKINAERNVGEN